MIDPSAIIHSGARLAPGVGVGRAWLGWLLGDYRRREFERDHHALATHVLQELVTAMQAWSGILQ